MSTNYIKSGSIDIKSITMSNLTGSKNHDLRGQVIGFNIYEDILFPVVRASFTFSDNIDILTGFPIIGEEIIEVEFVTSGYDETVKYKFHVKSVENQAATPQNKGRMYIVHATSEEFVTNNVKYVTKKYSLGAGDIVQNIAKEFLNTDKNVSVGDVPKGIQEILISRLKPLQAIDMVRRRSVSEKYLSSTYVFFENQTGFNFCTVEFLMDNLKSKVKDKIFFYDTAPDTDAKNMNTRNILSIENVSQVNNTKKLAQGSLNNIVKRFDLMTGEMTVTQYKNTEQQGKFKYASDKPVGLNTTHYEDTYGAEASQVMVVPFSSHLPETFTAESMGAKISFATKLSQNIFHAEVHGDSALTAGDVIEIRLPNAVGSTDKPEENRLISGNYLMSKVRHSVICPLGSEKTYSCSLELIKGTNEDNS